MANTRAGNVIRVDTTATFEDARNIVAIKYIGAASGTASIAKNGGGGGVVWSESGTTNVFNEVCIRTPQGVTVTIGSGAVVLIYLK